MFSAQAGYEPSLGVFLQSLRTASVESSIEYLISLLKRRQIRTSKSCALATAHLLQYVVKEGGSRATGDTLIYRVQSVGKRLIEAEPKALGVGNAMYRVLRLIREEVKENRAEDGSDSASNIGSPRRDQNGNSPLSSRQSPQSSDAPSQDMLNLLSGTYSMNTIPTLSSLASSGRQAAKAVADTTNLQSEVMTGIEEIIDEVIQADDQIAAFAQEQIHSNEVILTCSTSLSVQRFLLKAAEKRKFELIFTASDINEDLTATFLKPLCAAGISVIVTSDAAVFSMMPKVDKVILGSQIVLANGGVIAAAGARMVAKAAKNHTKPVIVLTGVFQLSPEWPADPGSLIEYGNPGKVIGCHDGAWVDSLEVKNPTNVYVPPELVDLYITNLGPCPRTKLPTIIVDHYPAEDIISNNPDSGGDPVF